MQLLASGKQILLFTNGKVAVQQLKIHTNVVFVFYSSMVLLTRAYFKCAVVAKCAVVKSKCAAVKSDLCSCK